MHLFKSFQLQSYVTLLKNEGCVQEPGNEQNYVKFKTSGDGTYKINIPSDITGDKLCVITIYNTSDLAGVSSKDK